MGRGVPVPALQLTPAGRDYALPFATTNVSRIRGRTVATPGLRRSPSTVLWSPRAAAGRADGYLPVLAASAAIHHQDVWVAGRRLPFKAADVRRLG